MKGAPTSEGVCVGPVETGDSVGTTVGIMIAIIVGISIANSAC